MRRQRRSASQGASGAWTSDAVAARLESKLVGLNLVELQHRGVKLLWAAWWPCVVVGQQRNSRRGTPSATSVPFQDILWDNTNLRRGES